MFAFGLVSKRSRREERKCAAFLTGTDEMLFEGLRGRAQGFAVEGSGLAEIG